MRAGGEKGKIIILQAKISNYVVCTKIMKNLRSQGYDISILVQGVHRNLEEFERRERNRDG